MANDKRLIDADVLKTLFDVHYDTAFIQERTRENKEQWRGYCTGINWGRNTIADAPTVDAVEVVRCKDCRFIIDREDGTHGCYLHFLEDCKPDDYCSYGERKDNG